LRKNLKVEDDEEFTAVLPESELQSTVPFQIYRPSQVTSRVVMVDFGAVSHVTCPRAECDTAFWVRPSAAHQENCRLKVEIRSLSRVMAWVGRS
jgi:hypothetical protein